MENDVVSKEIFNLVKLITVLLFILDTLLLSYHYKAIKSSGLDCYNSCLQLFVGGDSRLSGMIHREGNAVTCECLTISQTPKVFALEEETHVSYSKVERYARK